VVGIPNARVTGESATGDGGGRTWTVTLRGRRQSSGTLIAVGAAPLVSGVTSAISYGAVAGGLAESASELMQQKTPNAGSIIGAGIAGGITGASRELRFPLPLRTRPHHSSWRLVGAPGQNGVAAAAGGGAIADAMRTPQPTPPPIVPQTPSLPPLPISSTTRRTARLRRGFRAAGITQAIKLVTGEWIYP
jgi:hypothetical protein